MKSKTFVVIMAGGIGSRFWPASRTNYPKQFLDILGIGRTLIQQTFDRFANEHEVSNIYVVTAHEYKEIVQKQLPLIPKENILAEPQKKNTAPCIAYIAFKLLQKNADASMIVAPSDHLITNENVFLSTCKLALDFVAENEALVTLGMKPMYPNTGYGYIQYNTQSTTDICKVLAFKEKPSKENALMYIQSGNYLWNAGIFVWKASAIVQAIQAHLPQVFELFDSIKNELDTERESIAIENVYALCSNVSIDIGVMEKSKNVFVIPSSFGWSDLGTWNSVWENMEKDEKQNAKHGDVKLIESEGCVIHSSNERLIMVQGLSEYILVDTKDVLLICKKEKEQEIKNYVNELKAEKKGIYL